MRLLILSLLFYCSHARTICEVTTMDVTMALNELANLDENGGNQNEIVVNFQNMASGKYFDHDNAPSPLFTSVSSYVSGGETFKAFEKLQALYMIPDIDKEDPDTDERIAEANNFIEAIFKTKVIQSAWHFLVDASLSSADAAIFKRQLFDLWFTPYARKTAVGSSGFETVFVGEANGKDVIGLSYWYRYYLLEQTDSVNYHGWFTRQKGVQLELQFEWGTYEAMRGSFLIGTSPEFDFAAYTICALAEVGVCQYTKNDQTVYIKVTTLNKEGIAVIESVYPSGEVTTSTTQRPTENPYPNEKLQETVNAMRAADEDKPVDYELDYGNERSGNSDVSPNPLYKSFNEELFERPIYKALIDLYNNNVYDPDVCNEDGEIAGNRKLYIDNVFNAFTNTTVFQLALKFLQDIGEVSDWATFRDKLYTFWFGRYSRCSEPLGSSGWEHVFIGEWKGTTVSGQHCFVKYYLLEKANEINYHGYISYVGQLTGTFQYKWNKYLKQIGGFNLGTSPVFDFSILSICALINPGSNSCKFTIDGVPIAVTSYTQTCEGNNTCISTAYPSN